MLDVSLLARAGGAFHVSAPLAIAESRIVSCRAAIQGGAGFITRTVVAVARSLFAENTCAGRSGNRARQRGLALTRARSGMAHTTTDSGGCLFGESSSVSVSASQFEHNIAAREGGVVFLTNSSFGLPHTHS